MMSMKIPTAYYGIAKDPRYTPQNVVERVRKFKALSADPKQVGMSPDLAKEFTVSRLKAGY